MENRRAGDCLASTARLLWLPLKITLATAFPADPERPRGGVEAVSVILADALARQPSIEIHVVTVDEACTAAHVSQWNRVTVHRLPWRARRMLTGAVGAAGAAVRGYVQHLGADVVHAHDTYGLMLSDLDGPRVLTIHGFIHADTAVSGEPLAAVRSRLWRRAEHRAWSRFPHIISISPYVRERLTGVATGAIHDIDNPTALPFFDVVRRDAGNRIFCAASITPRKNIAGLVEAFAILRQRFPAAHLRIAGPAPAPGYAAQVRERIRVLGLDESVTLLPSLATSDVCAELSAASVAALVSLEENAPLTVQEAMAAAVPVVTSNRCGMPYQVQDGENGFLVDPLDPAAVADRLAWLLENPAARLQMGRSGRAVADARFHADAVATRTRRVYELAAGRPFSPLSAASQSV